MKKIISLALVLAFVVVGFAGCDQNSGGGQGTPANRLERIKQDGEIVFVTAPGFAPFIFLDPNLTGDEAIVGSDATMARFIAQELGVDLVIQTMDFATSLAAVQTGSADMFIGGLSWRPEREEAMMLSSRYMPPTFQGIMVMADRLDDFRTAEDFDGALIGAQNASLQQDNVEQQLPNARVQLVADVSDGIMMLMTGNIDALAMAGTVGEQYVRNYPHLAMSEFRFEMHPNLGNVIAMPLGSYELFEAIEEILAYIAENELYELWFEQANDLVDELAID